MISPAFPRTGNSGIFHGPAGPDRSGKKRRGFTLIEVLLVVAIIGIVTAIVLPSFVKSIRGNRLRMAARSVVMIGRYTYSMSLLKQSEMALVFNLDAAEMSVNRMSGVPAAQENAAGPDASQDILATNVPVTRIENTSEMVHKLDGVRIESVDIAGVGSVTTGQCAILYYSNGRCTPYAVRLADDSGGETSVSVDELSMATTEGGR